LKSDFQVKKGDIIKIISDRLNRSRGVEFEIFFSQKKVLSLEIKDGQVDHFRSSREVGLALRVLDRGRLGFSYVFGPTPDSLIWSTEKAVKLASQADFDPIYAFPPAERLDTLDLGLFDRGLSKIGKKEKIGLVREMEDSALGADSRIKKVRKAEYEEITNHISIINSKGLDLEREGTIITMALMVLAEENKDSEMGWEFDYARIYGDIDPVKIGNSAAKRGISRLGGRGISTRTCPAVLENRVVCDLLCAWSPSFFGENVYKGKSLLKDKINQIIASPRIQVIDDGQYPRGLGSAPFDDEGTAQKRTVLVKDGRLLSYLFDRYWSLKTGSELTGNSVRDKISAPPSTSISNLFISPGSLSFDQLIATMDKGFLINELMGVHLIDPVSGEFSLGASGIWIEKGMTVFPVKGVTISGSLHDLFSTVEELGSDLRFFGRVGAPSLFLREIIISGP